MHFSSRTIYSHHNHQSVLPKGRSFTANSGRKAEVLPKGRSFIANSGTTVVILLGMNRCGSFPLRSDPHSLFSIWTDLKRPGKDSRGPSVKVRRVDLTNWTLRAWHRNSPQGLNIGQIRDPEIPITFRNFYNSWNFWLRFNTGSSIQGFSK